MCSCGQAPFWRPTLPFALVRRGSGVTETPAPTQTLDNVFLRELDGLARWARGDVDDNRNDARLAIKNQEILMAMYESARTHTLVRLPLRTMGAPLIEAITTGELPVEFPGRYDTRYASTGPCAPATDRKAGLWPQAQARPLVSERIKRIRAGHRHPNRPQPVGYAHRSRVFGQHVIKILVRLGRFVGPAAPQHDALPSQRRPHLRPVTTPGAVCTQRLRLRL